MAMPLGQLAAWALFDGNGGAVRRGGIYRRARRRDVERNTLCPRGQRERIRADLVRHIAVGGNAISPNEHRPDIAPAKPSGHHAVGHHRYRNSGPVELPSSEPTSL